MSKNNPVKVQITQQDPYYSVICNEERKQVVEASSTAKYNDLAQYFEHFTNPSHFDIQLSVLTSLLLECIERQKQFTSEELHSLFFGRKNFIDELRWIISKKLYQLDRIDRSEKYVEHS